MGRVDRPAWLLLGAMFVWYVARALVPALCTGEQVAGTVAAGVLFVGIVVVAVIVARLRPERG